MSSSYKDRKVHKKQRRCVAIISNDCGVHHSEEPTKYLSILNAGLATGLTEELIIETTNSYGLLDQVVMLPGKSYCFLACQTVADAENIYSNLHNQANIGQNGAIAFLDYFEGLPKSTTNIWLQDLPKGISLLQDFISTAEEQEIIEALNLSEEASLKHRRVKHYGYEFLYDINNVDVNKPLEQQLPEVCKTLWPRLIAAQAKRGIHFENWQDPDQLTVNCYEPGQGIPPHVDTHSAFLEPIMSLSLLGDTVMDFRRGTERVPVLLTARSLLVMAGESRYDWTHGITPRFQDVVPSKTGALTTQTRRKRISLTFRRLRRGPCHCKYPTLCDSQLEQKVLTAKPQLEAVAARLEDLNVHRVYDEIAMHFSETRHTPWPRVAEFLKGFASGAVLIDVGCGNGKYLQCNANALSIGCDRSMGLLQICALRGNSTFRCDCLSLPVRTGAVDGCISIAVIHHLATMERRLQALAEMARILRKGGRALVYVWAKNQQNNAKKSSYLLQNKAVNKNKSTENEQRQKNLQETQNIDATVSLPIHTNRTAFEHQDVLVPWKLKNQEDKKSCNGGDVEKIGAGVGSAETQTFLRYYHVFEAGELEKLLENITIVKVIESYYDQGNHCVIFERL